MSFSLWSGSPPLSLHQLASTNVRRDSSVLRLSSARKSTLTSSASYATLWERIQSWWSPAIQSCRSVRYIFRRLLLHNLQVVSTLLPLNRSRHHLFPSVAPHHPRCINSIWPRWRSLEKTSQHTPPKELPHFRLRPLTHFPCERALPTIPLPP